MNSDTYNYTNQLPTGVMFNAYPDSIGSKLSDSVALLKRPELEGVFSLFYILPTFFNSDLDRGFSLIDYDINQELVSQEDLDELKELNILLKFDLILNHLSVGSSQFKDLLKLGKISEYYDFFINWNEFWEGLGEMSVEGYIIPKPDLLQKLFMRKPGLPILKVRFPDGTEQPYWNTFYQQIDYQPLSVEDLNAISGLATEQANKAIKLINEKLALKEDFRSALGELPSSISDEIYKIVEQKQTYLGQMDLNARSEKVWQFYDETFRKLKSYGATLVRLDAFAYLHKEPGMTNFFNMPETWHYLSRLREMAQQYDLILLPEIHSEYGNLLHEAVADKGFPIYDFFFPGLVIDALDRHTAQALLIWIDKILSRKMVTINMLGCHDGIPVLDLKGASASGNDNFLLTADEIEQIVTTIMERGGRVKNLYGPDGKKIAYYQVNATFFSALGEDENKLLLARAIQMFMPGIPQVWYLDLFAGKNNYKAADEGGAAGHKEINRTTLTVQDIESGLQRPIVLNQLKLMHLRNNSAAFKGEIDIDRSDHSKLRIQWNNAGVVAKLDADLKSYEFNVSYTNHEGITEQLNFI